MNAEEKPVYKQSEAGLIPADWKVHQLAELSGSIASGRSKVDAEFGQFPVYGSTGVIGYTNTPSHTGESILVARVGANAGLLNSADGRYGVTDNTIAIRLKPGFDHSYCLLQLKRYGLNRLVFGSGQPLITGTQLKGIPIPTPTSEEQVEIVSALSEMEDLLRSLGQLIAKKRDIQKATMQQLLTGQRRLPGFSGEWLKVKAGEIGTFRGGSGFPNKFQGEASGEFPFYKVSDMNNEGNDIFMSTANNYINEGVRKTIGSIIFPANSIVFAKVGAAVFLERKKILTRPSCLDNNMAAFIVDERRVCVRFMHYALLNIRLGDLVSTTALPSLSGSVLSNIELHLPPLAEQTAIATALSDIDAELTTLESRRDKARYLKQGMMQELLTGRIRLTNNVL